MTPHYFVLVPFGPAPCLALDTRTMKDVEGVSQGVSTFIQTIGYHRFFKQGGTKLLRCGRRFASAERRLRGCEASASVSSESAHHCYLNFQGPKSIPINALI